MKKNSFRNETKEVIHTKLFKAAPEVFQSILEFLLNFNFLDFRVCDHALREQMAEVCSFQFNNALWKHDEVVLLTWSVLVMTRQTYNFSMMSHLVFWSRWPYKNARRIEVVKRKQCPKIFLLIASINKILMFYIFVTKNNSVFLLQMT
jgi:hypothetical protein